MRRALRGALWIAGITLLGALPAPAQQSFTVPSQLDVTSINGVGGDEPVVTADFQVAVGFQTDAVQSATWIVYPVDGLTGSSAVLPPASSLGVNIPQGQANSPVPIRLGIKAIAPATATTLPAFTGSGTMSVIVDTEPPEVTVTEIVVGERRVAYDPGETLFVNQDFTVVGQVTDNVAAPGEITVEGRIGGSSSGSATVEESGRFEVSIPVSGLSDGSYDVEIVAEDVMSDESQPNRRVFRLEM